MLNFATLNQARQGLQASEQKHHQQSAELYLQGRALTREGLQDPIDKAKLTEASGCYARGIQLDYRNPTNYLGMAFLFLLLDQPAEALPFIKSALEIEPASELGQEMMQQAQEDLSKLVGKKSSVAVPVTHAPLPSEGPIDYDAIYDRTEASIMLFLKEILTDEVLGYQPIPDPKRLKHLRQKHEVFQTRTLALHEQLEILDREMESGELRQHLSKVEQALKRLGSLEQLFEQFIELHADILKHSDLTQDVMTESQSTEDPEDIPVLEENLNVLLDHCDSVADRLEALENQRHDIAPLQSPYQSYSEQLEQFQDILEETIERLKLSKPS
ncbi:MAG: hypothetical protein CVV27_00040 [Candidatus Melainabacteria bacterium HGW-Melainabacteria-1]|nr:MAG: hypothetical protein CVV27_00040 [Candidatus Melainabacteria bacterium HGW-Melainabacteria-1]